MYSAVIVQDFDGVAVEDGDDGAGKVGRVGFLSRSYAENHQWQSECQGEGLTAVVSLALNFLLHPRPTLCQLPQPTFRA